MLVKDEKLIIKSMKNNLECVLRENVTTRVTYSGARLSRNFTRIKDKTAKEYQHDIIYYMKCPKCQCSKDYIGETVQSFSYRMLDHNRRDPQSHLVKHVFKNATSTLK